MFVRPSLLVKRGWCRGRYATNRYYEEVMPLDTTADKWCILGAIVAAFSTAAERVVAMRRANDHAMMLGFRSAVIWQDMPHRTQEDVIQFLQDLEM